MTEHAIQRAQERYGLTLTNADLREILAMVNGGRSVLTKKTHNAEVHALMFRDVTMVALVDQAKQSVISFFPPEAIHSSDPRRPNGKRKPPAPHP